MTDTNFIANEDMLKLFFYTMYERQQMWYKRFILKLPQEEWTNNEYYTKYRFTNVYRELDRASQYLLKNIILNNDSWRKYVDDDDNYVNLVWKILFFRIINNPRVFTNVEVIADFDKYDPNEFYKYLKENIIDQGLPFAHGAFCQFSKHEITDENGNTHKFENMPEFFAKYVLTRLHSHIKDIYKWMKDSFNNETTADDFIDYMSRTIDACGRFIAHEFFQDFCYIKPYTGLNLMRYTVNDATNAGPGSTAGAKIIFNNVKSKKDVINAIKYLCSISEDKLKEIQKEKFPESDGFYFIQWDRDSNSYKRVDCNITLNQIEMWLCEFYKYVNYTKSTGKIRIYSNKKSSNDLLY